MISHLKMIIGMYAVRQIDYFFAIRHQQFSAALRNSKLNVV